MHDLKFLHFSLQLGCHLAMMCNGTIQSDLLQRITSLRKAMARDLEIFIPEIRIRDNLDLKPGEYLLLANCRKIARGRVYPGYFAMFPSENLDAEILRNRLGGTYIDRASNKRVTLIRPEIRAMVETQGYLIVDTIDLFISHLNQSLLRFAHESTPYRRTRTNG